MTTRALGILIAAFSGALAAVAAQDRSPQPSNADLARAPEFTTRQLVEGPGDDWHTIGGNLGQTRYSTLTQINTSNVKDLELAWTTTFDGKLSNEVESEPLEYNGVVYLVTGNNNVVAANATNGEKIWQWATFDGPKPATRNAPVRGLALGGGYVYVQTNVGRVVALYASTGTVKWQAIVSLNGGDQEGSPAPVYHNGVLYVGVSGRENGRGHVDALNARTGQILWRSFVIGTENDHPNTGGGGVWISPSIDPALGLLYAVTGNADRLTKETDAKWTSSIVAMDIKTGAIRWGFQGVHHDIWDYDCPSPPILFDVPINGVLRRGVEFQCKSGYHFELDRATGQPLLPVKEVPIPQALGGSSPDPAAMAANPFVSPTQPQMQGSNDVVPHCVTPAMLPGPAPDGAPYKYTCTYSIPGVDAYTTFTPGFLGGMTWQADAIDPVRGYLYVCAIAGAAQAWKVNPRGGAPLSAGRFLAPQAGWSGSVAAINLRDNTTVWLNKWMDGQTCFSGIAATAGGVIFTADNRVTGPSKVYAFDSASGQELWSYQTPQPIASAPIVYAVRGRQYVAFMGGGQVPLVGGIPAPFERQDALYVFALKTGTRPAQASTRATAAVATRVETAPASPTPSGGGSRNTDGRSVFIASCGSCHTFKPAETTGTGGPDLGIFGPLSATAVADVVRRGTAGPTGTMPAFFDRLTNDQIEQVASFVSEATGR